MNEEWASCRTTAAHSPHLCGECEVFPRCLTAPHLHFVHNQHFYSMKGSPAVPPALTRWVKSCDTGSFLQATFHLQMSGSRVTHAGETLCYVTPSEELCSFLCPRDVSLRRCWIIQMLHVWFIYVYIIRQEREWQDQSGTCIVFFG